MTKLSVNINKLATLRNSRGGNNPDLIKSALDIERFGRQKQIEMKVVSCDDALALHGLIHQGVAATAQDADVQD